MGVGKDEITKWEKTFNFQIVEDEDDVENAERPEEVQVHKITLNAVKYYS